MKPLQRGKETGLVEIPANWYVAPFSNFNRSNKYAEHAMHSRYLDDLPPMMYVRACCSDLHPEHRSIVLKRFIKSSANSHGWVNTRDVEDLWRDTFSYCYRYAHRPFIISLLTDFVFQREEEDFIFPITIHPDVSG